jgi:hypothetical protein
VCRKVVAHESVVFLAFLKHEAVFELLTGLIRDFALLHVLLGVEVWNVRDVEVSYSVNGEVADGATKGGPALSIVPGLAKLGQSRMGPFNASCKSHAFIAPDPQLTSHMEEAIPILTSRQMALGDPTRRHSPLAGLTPTIGRR